MKILVIHLLRIGDVISSLPVLTGLRKKYPDAQIDLLINKECRIIKPLLQMINGEIIEFDRKSIQAGLGDIEANFFQSYDLLTKLTNQLNNKGYSEVINLTQNKLSGYLVGMLSAPKKLGMNINCNQDMKDNVKFNSKWLSFLNSEESKADERIHYTDIFRLALELDEFEIDYGVKETRVGIIEASNIVKGSLSRANKYVSIQLYTSDKRKDWPEEKFYKLFKYMDIFCPGTSFLLLGSKAEEKKILEFIRTAKEGHGRENLFPAICSFEGALSVLKRSELLITGDTSIKHLSCAGNVPVLEICLGPSDYKTTGPYSENNIVVRSKEKCQPCDFSGKCFRSKMYCSENISSELISLLARNLINKDKKSLEMVAEKYSFETEILETKRHRKSINGSYVSNCWEAVGFNENLQSSSVDIEMYEC